jgi:cytidylate kinase
MRTIAISRLVVSEGATIARQVTEALAYTLVNKSVLEGIFRQHGLTTFGDLYTSPPNLWDLANAQNLQLVSMLNDTMDALAHRGDTLILGRGGYASLSKYEDALNVRLQAPFLVRVERVIARENIAIACEPYQPKWLRTGSSKQRGHFRPKKIPGKCSHSRSRQSRP